MSLRISDLVAAGILEGSTIRRTGGTSSQFLKADGSVDSNSYLTGITSTQVTNALGYTPYNSSNPNGYITSSALSAYLPLSGGTMTGNITMNARIVIQNGTDGGGDRGIWMWTGGDSNWGIYMGTAGSGRSLANGTAPTGIDGSSSHHIRFRVAGGSGNGFVWENNSELALMSLKGDNGNLYTRGQIYAGNSTSNLVLHAGNYTSYAAPAANFRHLGAGINYDVDRTTKVSGGVAVYSGYSGGTNRPTTYDVTAQFNVNGAMGFEIAADWISTSGPTLFARSLRDCCQNWSSWVTLWTSANLTNLNQLSNGPGYITSSALSSYLPLAGGTLTGKVTFPSAVADRPQMPGGILGLNTGDGNFDIWGISTEYYPSHPTGSNAWGIQWNGDNNQVRFIGASVQRLVIDLDGGNSGLTWEGNTVWHAGNLTNLNQLTNGPGYITSASNWFGAETTSGTTDWNHVTNTRPGTGYTLLLGSHTNGFGVGDYYHAFNLEYASKTGGGNVTQLAISYGTPGNDIRMRGRYEGSWTGWTRFLNTSNSPFAINMNQNVRTSDNVEFNQVTVRGAMYVGAWTNGSSIYMVDGDEGTREIHCNSNRIGFLTQSSSWGAYADDGGNWTTVGALTHSNLVTEYAGTMSTCDDWPNCQCQARVYRIGTLNSGGSNNSFIEVEVFGSHRGYTQTVYVEYKKWIIWVGDRISSNLVASAGSHNQVGLWNGSNANGLLGINGDHVASGWVLRLVVNPTCGAGVNYTVKVKYSNLNMSHGPFDVVANISAPSIPLAVYHVSGTNAQVYGNLYVSNGITSVAPINSEGAIRLNSGSLGNSPRLVFGTENEGVAGNKSMYLENYWLVIQPHVNEGLRLRFVNGSGTQTEAITFQSTNTTIRTKITYTDATYMTGSPSHGFRFNSANDNFNNVIMRDNGSVEVRGSLIAGSVGSAPQATIQAVGGLRWSSGGNSYYTYSDMDSGGLYIETVDNNTSRAKMRFQTRVNNTGNYIQYQLDANNSRFYWEGGGSAKATLSASTGTFTVSGDVIAYGSPSDIKLKTIKSKVDNAVEKVSKLNGYYFDWKDVDSLTNIKEDIGVIAQEVQQIFPELARTNEDGKMSVRYQGLTAVLIEAIKEQQKQIEELKSQIQKQ